MTSPAAAQADDAGADWYRCATRPRSVAIVGASDDPERSRYLRNLRAGGFAGAVYAVNPARATVLGEPAYPSLRDLPAPVDSVIIQVAAARVPEIMSDVAGSGAGCVYIGSAGFAETGAEGAELQRQVVIRAAAAGARVLGPNGNGIMSARSSFLGAGFVLTDEARAGIRDEGVAVVGQSGAVAACVLAMAQQAGLPVGTYFATGNACDVSMAEVLEQLAQDQSVRVVLLYLEGLHDGPRFLRAADQARARGTVVAALKVGISEAGARVSVSHTAALAGDDAAYDGLFRQHGIVRAASATALVDIGRVVRAIGPAVGRRAGVVSFSGGISVMLTDALAGQGFTLPAWSPAVSDVIRRQLPAYASVRNPVDGTGALTATPETLEAVLRAAHGDPATEMTVVGLGILHAKEKDLAEAIVRVRQGSGKPLLAAWLGGTGVASAVLDAGGVPAFTDVPALAAALGAVAAAGWPPGGEAEPPAAIPEGPDRPASADVRAILDAARARGATMLGEVEAKRLLAAGGLETVRELTVSGPDGVRAALSTLALPVVAKLASADLAHKSDVNAVRLGLASAAAAEAAVTELLALAADLGLADAAVVLQEQVSGGSELLLGMKRDATFGPLIVVGPGGILAEALQDVAIGGAPLTAVQAERLLARLRHRRLIAGFRGRPAMVTAGVTEAIRSFSELAAALPDSVLSVDVNPVIVRPDGSAVAVDALVEIVPDSRLRAEVADEVRAQ